MAYNKTVWVNGEEPAINAENLNKIEAALESHDTDISDLKSQIEDIEEQIEGGTGDGLTSAIKSALLQIAQKVAYIDEDGQDYYDDLYDALYPPVVYTAITLNTNSLSFGALNTTQTLVATTTPRGGAVAWSSSNTSVATVSQTGVVTSAGYGNATITATCGNLSATCSVAITQATVTSISAVFNQVGVTVYDTDSLDSLKAHLTVRATYSNSSTVTLDDSDYTLSGTLTVGTSTIAVSYGGKTATFNVVVTVAWDISWDYTDGLPEDNGFTKTYSQGAAIMTANGLECTGDNLAYTPNNEQSCTKAVFECVFIPEVLGSQSSPSGNGIKLVVFNGTRATTIGINSNGICGYKASISGYEIAYSNISVNTEYTIRIETEGDTGTVYLNDESVYTVALAATAATNNRIFASTGETSAKTLFKAFRYKFVQ